MSVRSEGKQHDFQTSGKRGRAGAKLSQRRLERRSREDIVDATEYALDLYADAVLFATGHLPEDF